MSLQLLLSQIEDELAGTGGIADAGDVIDELYTQVTSPNFVWDEPKPKAFNLFMKAFSLYVRSEQKSGQGLVFREMRVKAIDYIAKTLTATSTHSFQDITPLMFGVQLALRVRRPSTLDQGRTGLCGAASVIYAFAKESPLGFAHFALELYLTGLGRFKTLVVEPTPAILSNYRRRRNKIPWAVDYVTLVSLRKCSFFADARGLGALRPVDETTMPGQLADWLRQAGYDGVQDSTFFGKNQYKPVAAFASAIRQPLHFGQNTGKADTNTDRLGLAKTNLAGAIQSLNAGNLVVLFGDGAIADALQNGTAQNLAARQAPTGVGKHHWITVRKLDNQNGVVRIRAFTWGRTYEGNFDEAAFLARYNGYISAIP